MVYVKCPNCRRPMIRGLFQRHQLSSEKYVICINATQFRCPRCNTSIENKTGGSHLSHDSRNRVIGKHNLYITSFSEVDLVSLTVHGTDGTDYLYRGDLA